MYRDVLRRLPWYASDWTDAWDYRVVPATLYMYFANILPALAFSLDMFSRTNMSYGVNEVLLSSVIASGVFSFFAAQPLVIVGVTGPITVFNYTVYEIMNPRGTDYFGFMCWIGLWSMVFHTILAVCNSCVALRYVTKLPCDTFGFFVAIVYLEKGVDVLIRLFPSSGSSAPNATSEAAYLSIVVSLLTLLIAYTFLPSVSQSTLFRAPIRKFIEDYGLPLTVVFLSGMVHVGKMRSVQLEYLPTNGRSFQPTAVNEDIGNRQGWIIHFWKMSVGDIFLALPFGFLLTVLFWFDHNVSSLIAQANTFPLRKPAGFHWDLFLLGLTTGLTGILGLPFPNGLIPQAPFHTQSLCVYPSPAEVKAELRERRERSFADPTRGAKKEVNGSISASPSESGSPSPIDTSIPTRVVEQRVSNLAQGLITLFTMSGPALVALRQIPQGVLAGLFFVMGLQALMGNDIARNVGSLFQDPHLAVDPELAALALAGNKGRSSSRKPLITFLVIELVVIGVSFGITHTVASIGFPLFFALLIPARHIPWLIPALIRDSAVLEALDGPVASASTLEGVYVDDDDDDLRGNGGHEGAGVGNGGGDNEKNQSNGARMGRITSREGAPDPLRDAEDGVATGVTVGSLK